MKIINYKVIIFFFLNVTLTSCYTQTRVRSYIMAEKEHCLIKDSFINKKIDKEEELKDSALKLIN